jgi:hypothetical protein
MIFVEIQNSWQIDLFRIYRNRGAFKDAYFNHVLAEVFKQSSQHDSLQDDLIIFFSDNHFCNVDNLDYKRLHAILLKHFKTVSFVSDGSYDFYLDPEYWSIADRINVGHGKFVKMFLQSVNQSVPNNPPSKMFGLHILRPDVHRLGILVELWRRDLLAHTDVRLGFRSHEFGNTEYRRSGNVDSVCFDFDICHRELYELIDSLPQGDRINFKDNETYRGDENIKKDIEKSQYRDFAIELICSSSIHDNVYISDEKMLRACLMKLPFIPIASRRTIRILNAVGYRTWNQLWDESWDDYSEVWLPTKIRAIADTCADIVSRYQVQQIPILTKETVEHNLKHLLYGFYDPIHRMENVDRFLDD